MEAKEEGRLEVEENRLEEETGGRCMDRWSRLQVAETVLFILFMLLQRLLVAAGSVSLEFLGELVQLLEGETVGEQEEEVMELVLRGIEETRSESAGRAGWGRSIGSFIGVVVLVVTGVDSVVYVLEGVSLS